MCVACLENSIVDWDIAILFEKPSFIELIFGFDFQGNGLNLKCISGPMCHWLCSDIC